MQFNYKLLLLFFFIPAIARAQYEQLASVNINDPAPPLRVSQWIKGTPVKQFEKGKVYVIEFWATWCHPCLAGMPHLSGLAQEYKDKVTVIAIDIYESKSKPKKSAKQVKAFVDSMGSKMDFNVAIEDSSFTVVDWIKATGEENSGIPITFVVNADGKLAWIGHASKLDEVLPKIVNNTWGLNEAMTKRNLNRHLALMDDSINYELMRFRGDLYKPGDFGKPDSALLMIRKIVSNEPNLKYAPLIALNTFSALLKTSPHEAYEYGKVAIITPTYDEPAYDVIIGAIEWYQDKLNLPAEIYELGTEAYQEKIDRYAQFGNINIPKNYSNMAAMYSHAKNKAKAIEAQQKAIEALKSKKDFSKKDLASLELKLQQYKNM